MNYRSDEIEEGVRVARVVNIKASSYFSRRDQCLVTLVKCDECARMHEQEITEAVAAVMGDKRLLCLECDPDAVVPAFSGVTIQVGFFGR